MKSCTEMRQMDTMQTTAGNEIFSYWLELTRNQAVPLQRDFEPARVRHRLQDLFILGYDLAGDLAFRLAGTRICSMFGRELRGQPYSKLWHDMQKAESGATIKAVLAGGQPVVCDVVGLAPDASHSYELLLLPLRSGDTQPDRVLGALLRRTPRASGVPETVFCLYSRASRAASLAMPREHQEKQRLSRFMRQLLAVENTGTELSNKES